MQKDREIHPEREHLFGCIECGAQWLCSSVGVQVKGTRVQNHLLPFRKHVLEEILKSIAPFCLVSIQGGVKDPMQENGKQSVIDSPTLEKNTLK